LPPLERELLSHLAATPLLDRVELAALSGRSPSAVYEGAGALADVGLVATVPHASELVPSARRLHLTSGGVEHLAGMDGMSVEALLRDQPASDEWLRALMRRLDAVAVIYRLASALSEIAFPIRFRWYRSAPADAAAALPDGGTLAIVRIGRSVERTALGHRLRRLREGAGYSAALLLAPDEFRLRHARRLATGMPFVCFSALERHAVAASVEAPIWRPPSGGAAVSLTTALKSVQRAGSWTREPTRQRRTAPRPFNARIGAQDWLLPSQLKPVQKRTLDLIADWPWLTPHHLEQMLGVGRRRVSQLSGQLQRSGLVASVKIAGRGRLALTDRALTMIANRDRASPALARKRWSASPLDAESPSDWRDVSGTRTRQLLRHIDHTEAVHGFAAGLAAQTRLGDLTLAQIEPPQRASRYFRYRDRLHSVQPDAYGLLLDRSDRLPFFLEWERRAIRPRAMAARLAPYLRYFSGRRPLDDHGAMPRLLVVFEDDLLAGRFIRVAAEEMARAGTRVPLAVTDRGRVAERGPLSPIWFAADDWQRRSAFSPLEH